MLFRATKVLYQDGGGTADTHSATAKGNRVQHDGHIQLSLTPVQKGEPFWKKIWQQISIYILWPHH